MDIEAGAVETEWGYGGEILCLFGQKISGPFVPSPLKNLGGGGGGGSPSGARGGHVC